MTGHLNLPENVSPAVAHAVRKDYVTTAIAAIPAPDLASKVSKTGDTMTGTLTVASGGSVNVTAGNVTANAGSVTAVHVHPARTAGRGFLIPTRASRPLLAITKAVLNKSLH
jgi:hypothetical protein